MSCLSILHQKFIEYYFVSVHFINNWNDLKCLLNIVRNQTDWKGHQYILSITNIPKLAKNNQKQYHNKTYHASYNFNKNQSIIWSPLFYQNAFFSYKQLQFLLWMQFQFPHNKILIVYIELTLKNWKDCQRVLICDFLGTKWQIRD